MSAEIMISGQMADLGDLRVSNFNWIQKYRSDSLNLIWINVDNYQGWLS